MSPKRKRLTNRIRALVSLDRADLDALLNRLELIAGDDVTEPDLLVIVRLYKREIIGRDAALTKE